MRKTRFIAVAATAAALAVAGPAQADVASDGTSIQITGGNLEFVQHAVADDFPALTLTGATATPRADIANWSVLDATGTGAGWTVNFTASQFTGTTDPTETLPTGSLNYTVPTAVTPGDPLNLLQAPDLVVAAGGLTLDTAGGAVVASAAAGKGAGEWDYTQANVLGDLALTVPAGVIADTYTSTITQTLAPNP